MTDLPWVAVIRRDEKMRVNGDVHIHVVQVGEAAGSVAGTAPIAERPRLKESTPAYRRSAPVVRRRNALPCEK